MSRVTEKGNRVRLWPRLATYALAVALLAIGVGAFVFLWLTTPRPDGQVQPSEGRLVRAFTAEAGPHRVAVTGYGTSRAGTEWAAIAEVAGRVLEVNEQFETGRFVPPGTALVRIDPTDYELAKRRSAAEVRSSQEQLRELTQQEGNLKETLALRERQMEIAKNELDRIRRLFEAGQEPRSSLEASEDAYVRQQAIVQELRNTLALLPSQRGRVEAALELAEAKQEEAEFKLSKTEITLPFQARCATRKVEADQYVGVGAELGRFYSLNKAEIVVMLEATKAFVLFSGHRAQTEPVDFERATRLFEERVRFAANVRWASGTELDFSWDGFTSRIEGALDPQTRSIQVVVEVPEPYKSVIPGVRPPLLPDVFCEVTLFGEPVENVIALPRECVRDNRVYLVRDGRLHIAAITPVAIEGDKVIVSAAGDGADAGVADGDTVVLADLFPAVEGMRLRVEPVDNPVRRRPVAPTAAEPAAAEDEEGAR